MHLLSLLSDTMRTTIRDVYRENGSGHVTEEPGSILVIRSQYENNQHQLEQV